MRIILNGRFIISVKEVSDVSSHQSRFDGKLIIAASFAVLTYWLFAQSFINIGSSVQKTFGATDSTLNLSITLYHSLQVFSWWVQEILQIKLETSR